MGLQSLLYHAFGLKDQDYLKTEYKEGQIIFHIRTKENKLRCSSCGSKNVIRKGKVLRQFKTLNIGLKPVILEAEIHRLECKECGLIRQENLPYADEKKLIPIP